MRLPATKGNPFEAKVSELPEPNRYQVLLKWNSESKPKVWTIYREEEGASYPKELVSLDSQAKEFADVLVEPGKNYRYELREITESNTRAFGEARVTIPRDYEVKGTVVAPEKIAATRLFLHAGAKLVTEGRDLKIHVDQIHSNGGVIETFPQGKSAAPEKAGRPGGQIEIKATSGTGTLFVYGRGENGGSGINGKDGAQGSKGKEGHYALSTHEKVDVLCNCGQREKELWDTIQNGGVLEKFMAFQQWHAERARHRCITQTGDGAPGADGLPGAPGTTGGIGGDASKIRVEITDAANIQVKAFAVQGKGAQGGEGGAGGPGGVGGDSGERNLDRFKVCRDASPGPFGQKGPAGARGKGGQDGASIAMCVKLGGAVFGDCSR